MFRPICINLLKRILMYCAKCNKTCVIYAYQSMFPMKNNLNVIFFFNTGSHKSFSIHYGLWGKEEYLERILVNIYCTK